MRNSAIDTPCNNGDILNGWKEIANYLEKGVRTVQRYEGAVGLPVRRPGRKSRGTVIASKAELDGWVAACPRRDDIQMLARCDDILRDTKRTLDELHRRVKELDRVSAAIRDSRAELRRSLQLLQNNLDSMVEQRRKPSPGCELARVLPFWSNELAA